MSSNNLLKSSWTLWYHNPESTDWEETSYIKIYKFRSLEEFWALYNKVPDLHFSTGMYFLMRDNILPLWEDENNKNGGCWSYKVSKKEAAKAYRELSMHLISERICMKYPNIITGISISPKKGFCIIKIWNNDCDKNDINLIAEEIQYLDREHTIYKAY